MNYNRAYLLLFLLSLGSLEPTEAIVYTSEVMTTYGPIQGKVSNFAIGTVRQYLAVPFAKAERFQPPQPPNPWTAVRKTISPGMACPQAASLFTPPSIMSEECLHLYVYVPNATVENSKLPVMVWVYGGAFVGGYAAPYDGSVIAGLGNVIVVCINYRVGAFGFIATGKDGLKGNYGLKDQVEALKWVKNNIERFGGDPNKVTIFGESAGGASVALLMLSPMTKGLFSHVIIQSGAANTPWSAGPYREAVKQAKEYGEALGCKSVDNLRECLKTKTIKEMVASNLVTKFPRLPVIDGEFLTDLPANLLAAGKFENRNIMIGLTNDEGTVSTNAVPGFGSGLNVTHGVTRSAFLQAVNLQLKTYPPSLRDVIIYRYTDWSAVDDKYRNRRMLLDLMGDMYFNAAVVASAKFFSKAGRAKTYFYLLERRVETPVIGLPYAPPYVKAYHGADIFFVFGKVLLNPNNTYTADGNLTREIITMWTNFAKSGDPNKPIKAQVSWPLHDPVSQQYLSLKQNMEVNAKLRVEYMALWNDLMPKLTNKTNRPTEGPPCSIGMTIQAETGYLHLLSVFLICASLSLHGGF